MGMSSTTCLIACLAMLGATSCNPRKQLENDLPPTTAIDSDHLGAAAPLRSVPVHARTLLESARARTSIDEVYDPSYFTIPYPGGDVPNDRGVCTDVIIRAYRAIGLDLQVLVHEDMRANFKSYPTLWGLNGPDKNIDHRRVPNLEAFLRRKSASLAITDNGDDYQPGDLVTWRLPGNLPHIGIVSDRRAPRSNRPLILHNIGSGTSEEDMLFAYAIHGHFRYYVGNTEARGNNP